ncbi:fumarylacetoacetate hydrolase family protein [Roseateles violae]|uniref:Fumarylacetoacetate hydrolase family protein n=1 Tax=Roseateles violae TaxID=3058042 RepID=A0ABT8DZD6_9BURK|nr:fumarylacetoacetate hydrolase family protein [Pelomonas sp. PFR6]MDN3922915.1 fumarylacetoacetate hydrolase family protein [Pelomonas sp. PFR6]
MPRTVVRYTHHARPHWGVLFGRRIAPLASGALSTGELLQSCWAPIWAAEAASATLPIDEVELLAPVTDRQQFICQGVNYRSHIAESGLRVEHFPFNTIFTKAPSCITAADAPVVRPAHVQLLDYEIELGLVLRRSLPAGTRVGPDDLPQWLAGVTIVNDLSARDVQLPQGQFYKGKSYRGFGPVGPGLVLLTPQEWARWPELHMRLSVNGQPRQDAYCADMIHGPAATLSELAAMHDLHAGDLIATGTPAGCAARAPGKLVMFVLKHLLSEAGKWRAFIGKGASNPAYLRPGDRIQASIRTDDGLIDLGEQTTRITAP